MKPRKRPHLIIHALAFVLSIFFAQAQEFTAGINTETPNPNAVLHLVSPNGDQGLLIPALTNAQRGAMGLAATDKGLLVFDRDDDAFYFWDGAGWVGLNVPASIADGIDWSELTGIPTNIDLDDTDDVTLAAFPNLDTDATDDVALGTIPAAGDISGDFTNGFQINPNIVSSLEITDGTISNADLGADAVQSGNILDGTIVDADISDVTAAKVTGLGTAATLNAGITDGDLIQVQTGGALPALDGSALTGVTATVVVDGSTITGDGNATNLAVGTIGDANISAVDWTKLTTVPAGFADGIDDIGGDMFAVTYDPNTIGGDAFNMSNHTTTTAPTSGDILTFNGTNWDAAPPSGGDMFASIYDPNTIGGDVFDLSIHTTPTAPNPGDVLEWNGSNWDVGVDDLGGDMFASIYDPNTIAGDAFDLSTHTTPTAPNPGDVLEWNGSNWDVGVDDLGGDMFASIYDPNTIGGDAFDLSIHTTPTAPNPGDVLEWNGSNWDVGVDDLGGDMFASIYDPNTIGGDAFDLSIHTTPTAPNPGDVLEWNGSNWDVGVDDLGGDMFASIYDPNTIGGDAFDLSTHTTPTAPNPGDVLEWNGSNWDVGVDDLGGDMFASIYDPNTIGGDAFDLSNHLSFTPPVDGDVLTWDNTNGRWDALAPSTLTLPFSATETNASDLFVITQTGSARAGAFTVNNPASTLPALEASSNGAINSYALLAQSNGGGDAARISYDNSTGTAQAMNVFTSGLGKTATFASNNAGNTDAVIEIFHTGTGQAIISNAPITTNAQMGIGTTTPAVSLDIQATDAVQIPVGTTAEQPGVPTDGMLRYNTDIAGFEGYVAGAWGPIAGAGGLVFEPNASSIVGGTGAAPGVTGTNNTIYGVNAGNSLTSGINNTYVGNSAGQSANGFSNTFVGDGSGSLTTGNENVFIGQTSGNINTSGNFNTFIGTGAGNGNVGAGNTTGSRITLLGYQADTGVDGLTNATAIGNRAVVSSDNSLVLGGTGTDAVSVGIGTTTPRAPLQIGGEFSIGYFQNSIEGISGDAILSNLYPDYTNLSDNELRRSNTDSASFIFFDDGEILFMNVVNGAADSQLALSGGDIRSWMEMRNNGNIHVSEGIRLGSPDVGDEEDGMIRYNGSSFEGYSAGAWNPLGGGGGLVLPYSSGATDPNTLFDITQGGSGSAGRFQVTNGANTVEALSASSDGAAGAIAFRAIGNVSADAGEFIADGTGTALQVNNTATSTGVVAAFQNSNVGNGNNVVSITTNGSGPALQINNTGTSGNAIRIDMNGANTVPGVEIVNSNGPSLTTDGFVGVGTVAPGSELDVVGETRTSTLNVASSRFVVANNGNTTINPSVAIDALNISQNNFARGVYVNMNGQVSNGIEIANSGGPSLVTDGNVGIGTVSPAAMLDVNGTANIASDATVGNLISTPNTDAIIDGNVSADTRVVVLTADDNITNISTPADGKEIFIIAGSGVNPQVSSGGNIRLDQAQGDFTMQSGSSIHLIYIENLSLWVEVSRSL